MNVVPAVPVQCKLGAPLHLYTVVPLGTVAQPNVEARMSVGTLLIVDEPRDAGAAPDVGTFEVADCYVEEQ